jgi:hypothetical protein
VVSPSYCSPKRKDDAVLLKTKLRDPTADTILERLSDTEHYPNEALTAYEEFTYGGKTYYFPPGGFLYCNEPGTEEVGGYFCGYLTNEVWHYRIDNGG